MFYFYIFLITNFGRSSAAQMISNFLLPSDPKHSLKCTQEPTSCQQPEPLEFIPHNHILFLISVVYWSRVLLKKLIVAKLGNIFLILFACLLIYSRIQLIAKEKIFYLDFLKHFAWTHSVVFVSKFLHEKNFPLVLQPPCLPDFISSDVFLFKNKEVLKRGGYFILYKAGRGNRTASKKISI